MESAIKLLTAVTLSFTALAAVLSVPFSPARFWAWRLRKHTDTAKTLDPTRHANQVEILACRGDYLASRLAAAHHIPFDRGVFILAVANVAGLGGVIATSVNLLRHGLPIWYGLTWLDAMPCLILPLFFWGEIKVFRYTLQRRKRRREFVRLGCPIEFEVPPKALPGRLFYPLTMK